MICDHFLNSLQCMPFITMAARCVYLSVALLLAVSNSINGQLSRDEKQAILDSHNSARRDEEVPNMRVMVRSKLLYSRFCNDYISTRIQKSIININGFSFYNRNGMIL